MRQMGFVPLYTVQSLLVVRRKQKIPRGTTATLELTRWPAGSFRQSRTRAYPASHDTALCTPCAEDIVGRSRAYFRGDQGRNAEAGRMIRRSVCWA
jgi:hypothetical protein